MAVHRLLAGRVGLMFKSFYAFSKNPFDKQQLLEKEGFPSCDHREMLSRLNYLKDTRGIGVFTAQPGQGKTFALRCFAKSLDGNLFDLKYICLSTVSAIEFYRQLCAALNLEPLFRKHDMFKSIQDRLFYLYKEKRRPLLLALDEAHELGPAILKDLKMITNHDYDSLNCFALILVGEPRLNHILDKPVHDALRQRIVIHYNFEGLSDPEVHDYIQHKFSLAGASASILGEGTLPAIISHCHGNPRLVDNLMTEALTLGAQLKKQTLDTEVLMASINNLALV
jgi:type II secretory pathway predicted ATPase ExeA